MMKKLLLFCLIAFFFLPLFSQEDTISISANLGMIGVKNARDLGGYQIGEKVVRKGKFIRSADLSKATDDDLKILEDSFHVALVVDLRTTMELISAQDNQPNNCLYMNLPCLEQTISSRAAFITGNQSLSIDDPLKLAELYLDSIENRKVRQLANVLHPYVVRSRVVQEQIGEVLDSLCSLPAESAALIHCTDGKDRTGWTATFFLAALGADRETLVQEFMKSEAFCQPHLDYILPKATERGLSDDQISTLKSLVGVNRQRFEEALDMIDTNYGSISDYLVKQLKFPESKQAILREKFLTTP